ncbi:hypothetical protein NQ315_005723 [Exocentrus adspersus]|uniref:Transposable element P transposase-like RNase H domain-containing protein n=1 Tax=Exocentrus adspersus TaxID=1586481 RepID=A0AAV8VIU0_9CUCU|nr:hypothetical protein NQ315_005723 [Exocentrus adspersus]
MLNAVPFNCGSNDSVFEYLTMVVNRMKDKEKYYVLMFNETTQTAYFNVLISANKILLNPIIVEYHSFEKRLFPVAHPVSLEAGLQYNIQNDSIDGFVDMGGDCRKAAFADHALLFMVKGTFKK